MIFWMIFLLWCFRLVWTDSDSESESFVLMAFCEFLVVPIIHSSLWNRTIQLFISENLYLLIFRWKMQARVLQLFDCIVSNNGWTWTFKTRQYSIETIWSFNCKCSLSSLRQKCSYFCWNSWISPLFLSLSGMSRVSWFRTIFLG